MDYTFRIFETFLLLPQKVGFVCFFSHSCQQVTALPLWKVTTLLGERPGKSGWRITPRWLFLNRYPRESRLPQNRACTGVGGRRGFLGRVHSRRETYFWSGGRLNASDHRGPLGTRDQPTCLQRMSAKGEVTVLVDDQVLSILSPTVKNSSLTPQHQPASLRERGDLSHLAPPKSQTGRACLVPLFLYQFFTDSHSGHNNFHFRSMWRAMTLHAKGHSF